MNEKIRKVINNPKFVPVVTGVVSFGVGISIGYFLGRNHKREIHIIPERKLLNYEDMEAFIKEETAKNGAVREETVVEEVVVETPVIDHAALQAGAEFVAQHIEEKIQSHQGSDPEKDSVEPVRRSIFAENTDEWDYDEEIRHRSPAAPYILHTDEFHGEEKAAEGYSHITLTYYAGDDIMSTEDDIPLYGYGSVIGPLKFGHGSGDPKVFYVRNDRRKAEYEIIHDSGLFSQEVMGLDIEDNQRVKALNKPDKFRSSD